MWYKTYFYLKVSENNFIELLDSSWETKMSEKEVALPPCEGDTMDEPKPEPKGPKVYRLMGSVKTALFILSTALLVFAAARNSFHW